MTRKAERMISLELNYRKLTTNYMLLGRDTVLEERVLLRLKDFIAPKVLTFQFYQCHLKRYKLILPHAKFRKHPSKRNNPKMS